MTIPVRNDLIIYQGVMFYKSWTWITDNSPVDLTGVTIQSQIRPFTQSDILYLDMSTDNGLMVIEDAAAGEFAMVLSDEDTANLDLRIGSVYDIVITFPNGYTDKLIYGNIAFEYGVTR